MSASPEDEAALAEVRAIMAAMCDAPHPTRTVPYGPNQGRPYLCNAGEKHPGSRHWRMTTASSYDSEWEAELWDDAGHIIRTVSHDSGKTWTELP